MVDLNPEEIKRWFDEVLPGPIKWRGYQGSARCPFPEHGSPDRHPSFSVNAQKGVWSCQKEGRSGKVKDLAEALGQPLPESWRTPPSRKRKTLDRKVSYGYVDESGELLYRVIRYEPKGFSQERPDGNDGWISNLDGVKRVPYRLVELMAAMDRNETIFIPEGEKDVDNLVSLGLQATCNSGGAGKWSEAHSKYFSKGVKVVILPDNDETGRTHGESVARSLKGHGCRVKTLSLPDLPDKGDVSDWLQAGHSRDELLKLEEKTPEWGEERRSRLMDLLQEPDPAKGVLPEMIAGLFPRGFLSVITADAGAGKTWLLLRIACDLSVGGEILDGLAEHETPFKVIFLEGDFGPGLIEARLRQTGFNHGPGFKVLYKSEVEENGFSLDLGTAGGQEALRDLIKGYLPDLLILDTLSAFHLSEENDNTAMKPIFMLCNRLAAEYHAAFVIAHHARKPKKSETNMVMTQHDTVGASVLQRMVGYLLGMEKQMRGDEEVHTLRVLKSWFKAVEPLAFTLEDGEEDEPGFPQVSMHIELDFDLQGGDRLSRLWSIIQNRYPDGKPFTKGMLERWTEGVLSARALKSLLPRLMKDGRLKSYGATRNRQYWIPGSKESPEEAGLGEWENRPNGEKSLSITEVDSGRWGGRMMYESSMPSPCLEKGFGQGAAPNQIQSSPESESDSSTGLPPSERLSEEENQKTPQSYPFQSRMLAEIGNR